MSLAPTHCELCPCASFRWNGSSDVYRTDPPTTCTCGHPAYRHVFAPKEGTRTP